MSEYQSFRNELRRNQRQEQIEIPIMLAALNLPRGKRMLEIGCGRGVALAPLAERLTPARMVGLDIDASLLAEAAVQVRDCVSPIELINADVRRIPFHDASFDVVIDFGTCYHINRSEQALSEIARVLAPNGCFVTETKVSQFLSHPVRSLGRHIPWHTAPNLEWKQWALLWQSRRRI